MHQSDHPDQYQHRYLINWIEYSQDVTPDSVFLLLVTCIQSQQADQFVFFGVMLPSMTSTDETHRSS